MTAEWAPKRIEIRQKNLPFYYGQFSAVGKYGTGAIYERIKEKIISLGGKIFFNETIIKFETDKKNTQEDLSFYETIPICIRQSICNSFRRLVILST